MRKPIFLLTAATLVLALTDSAGNAAVPGRINYQGLLLDSSGDPVTGNEDFVFALFDAPSGGTSLWSEAHDDVPVLDGVYDVVLGETTPITPALVSGGALHLEIAVGGETLSPRQQLLAVPYAIEAESAASVDGLPSLYITQAFEQFSFDGQDPPNQDASEGTGDTDGDGRANFLDPDNDDDGISDGSELAQGSDINLITPTLQGFSPDAAVDSDTTTVTVSGTGFLPGLSVSFGSESPAPQNLTSNQFDVDVGPQSAGAKTVVVTNANAESASASFDFRDPVFGGLSTNLGNVDFATLVTVSGSGFVPGVQVSVGSENPTPMNLTPTGFEVQVGPQARGLTTFEISYPSETVASVPFEFVDPNDPKLVFVTQVPSFDGDMGGIAGADATCNNIASVAGRPGTFMAWLGDGTADPLSRFTGGGPYDVVGVGEVAASFIDLVDGMIDAQIRGDQWGNLIPFGQAVWTGVGADGTAIGSDCNGWTSTTGNGRAGLSNQTDGTWTDWNDQSCGTLLRIYCFEQ